MKIERITNPAVPATVETFKSAKLVLNDHSTMEVGRGCEANTVFFFGTYHYADITADDLRDLAKEFNGIADLLDFEQEQNEPAPDTSPLKVGDRVERINSDHLWGCLKTGQVGTAAEIDSERMVRVEGGQHWHASANLRRVAR